MQYQNKFLVVVFIGLMAAVHAQDMMVGGYVPVDLKDSEVQDAAVFAFENARENGQLVMSDGMKIQLVKAEKKVVQGNMFRITMLIGVPGKQVSYECQFEVWFRPFLSDVNEQRKVVSSDCLPPTSEITMPLA